jgi:rod shape determining protein RodA
MQKAPTFTGFDLIVILPILLLIVISIIVLNSIAPSLFPQYYIFIVSGLVLFYIIFNIDYEIFMAFSLHLYILSIALLISTLIIGQVTRGAIRWIPIGSLTLQPSEITRPFLLLFFAKYLTEKQLNTKRFLKGLLLIIVPTFLILIQPSLGVAFLTLIGFFGVIIASSIKKKYIVGVISLFVLAIPLLWLVLAPYQKQRVVSFMNPESDPLGAGYNSIQSMISVGSGGISGRGLGKGVQTQLAFLPEKHTDFLFAAVAEEMGLLGSLLALACLFAIFWFLITRIRNSKQISARLFVTGIFLTLLAQTIIHVGMNMGLLPITGVPLPLLSAGGSSFLAIMMSLGIAFGSKS